VEGGRWPRSAPREGGLVDALAPWTRSPLWAPVAAEPATWPAFPSDPTPTRAGRTRRCACLTRSRG
jgi:hypothetical protein